MSTLTRTATVLAATAATITLTFANSGSAWAGSDARAWSRPFDGYSDGACDLQFDDYGEHFYLNDNLKDGAGCYGKVVVDDFLIYDMYNSKGAGTTAEYNYDFVEGAIVRMEVCVRDDGKVYWRTCSDPVTGRA